MAHKTEIKSDRELPADSHTPDWQSGINIIFHPSFIYYPPCCSAVIELTRSSTLTEGFGILQKDTQLSQGSNPCPCSYREQSVAARTQWHHNVILINSFKELTKVLPPYLTFCGPGCPFGSLTSFPTCPCSTYKILHFSKFHAHIFEVYLSYLTWKTSTHHVAFLFHLIVNQNKTTTTAL